MRSPTTRPSAPNSDGLLHALDGGRADRSAPERVMKVILHNGHTVAFAHGARIKLDPDLDALPPDHPDRRWAMALATFACLTETGDQPGPYTPDYAAEFARDVLLPIHQFVCRACFSDRAIAAAFKVPLDQVRHRRAELGLSPS